MCEYCSKDNFLVRIQDEVVYDFDDREYESHGTTWVTIIPRYCPLCGEKIKEKYLTSVKKVCYNYIITMRGENHERIERQNLYFLSIK